MSETKPLTDEEMEIIEDIGQVTIKFAGLGEHHPSDMPEFLEWSRRLQQLVMSRAALRAYPDYFGPMEKTVRHPGGLVIPHAVDGPTSPLHSVE